MASPKQQLMLDISWSALFKVVAFLVGIWAFIMLREVFIMLFGVFILVAAVNPTITRWQKHMSRLLAVALFYTLLILAIVLIISLFIPQLIRQINELIHVLPESVNQLRPYLDQVQGGPAIIDQSLQSLQGMLGSLTSNLLGTILAVFGGLATIATGLVLSFYLLLEEKNAREFFHQVLPQHRFEAVYHTVNKISIRMGSWVRGQLLLMAIVGLANFLLYTVIGLPSPLPLSIWAGLCEAIPYIGPVLGMLPALVVALTAGTLLQAILVILIGFVVIQQLEAHVLIPKIMGRAVGLSPVLVIIALTVGVKFLGLVGAILSIPAAAIISVVIGEWPELRKIWEGDGKYEESSSG